MTIWTRKRDDDKPAEPIKGQQELMPNEEFPGFAGSHPQMQLAQDLAERLGGDDEAQLLTIASSETIGAVAVIGRVEDGSVLVFPLPNGAMTLEDMEGEHSAKEYPNALALFIDFTTGSSSVDPVGQPMLFTALHEWDRSYASRLYDGWKTQGRAGAIDALDRLRKLLDEARKSD